MAVKSATEIKADIAALTPLVTLAQVQSILTDICDSFGLGGSGLSLYNDPSDVASIAAGDTNFNHGLDIKVYKVFVYKSDGSEVVEVDFTPTDTENTIITWVGTTWTSPSIYYLATK